MVRIARSEPNTVSNSYVRPMAWEWVSSAGTAAIGISAIIGANWASVRGRKHDQTMAADRYENERQTTHEQWIREHRKDAYMALLDLAERTGGLYVQRVHPLWPRTAGPVAEPELPDHEAQLLVRVRIMAYGSDTVKERMDEWHELVWKAIHAASDVEARVSGARTQLDELKKQELAARKALGRQMSAELQGNPGQAVERRAAEGS